jgi:hypothetical protein
MPRLRRQTKRQTTMALVARRRPLSSVLWSAVLPLLLVRISHTSLLPLYQPHASIYKRRPLTPVPLNSNSRNHVLFRQEAQMGQDPSVRGAPNRLPTRNGTLVEASFALCHAGRPPAVLEHVGCTATATDVDNNCVSVFTRKRLVGSDKRHRTTARDRNSDGAQSKRDVCACINDTRSSSQSRPRSQPRSTTAHVPVPSPSLRPITLLADEHAILFVV